MRYLVALLPLLSLASAQIGTATRNVSSASDSVSYVGNWRSDNAIGVYEAYSNESVASCEISFEGVGLQYIAYKRFDRGLFAIKLDGVTPYTVDLYENSGFPQPQFAAWTSPVLPYGNHSVELYQLGIDPRFGAYPYLVSETWIVTYPVDIPSYTATQATTTGAARATSASRPVFRQSTNVAPIVGGAVGGVLALGLMGFLFYLWRADKRARRRNEVGMLAVQEAKASKEKMSIEDSNGSGGSGDSGKRFRGEWIEEGRREREYRGADEYGRRGDRREYDDRHSSNYYPSRPSFDDYRSNNSRGYSQRPELQEDRPTNRQYHSQNSSSQQSRPVYPHRQSSFEALSLGGGSQQQQQSNRYSNGGNRREEDYSEYSSQPSYPQQRQEYPRSDPSRREDRDRRDDRQYENRGERERRGSSNGNGNGGGSAGTIASSGGYPYHIQGEEGRAYPVPEV